MSDREDFEKWAKDGFQLGKGCDGYLSAFTSSAFRAWQARQPEIDALKDKLESQEAQIPAQSHQLDDADIRAIALDCGFKLKPQPDGLEDLNPYVYRFAREILSTTPRAEDIDALRQRLTPPAQEDGCHKLDTPQRVFFYEQDFYVLSNFSAFALVWRGIRFDTSEAAYHYEKFPDHGHIRLNIRNALSAHAAFKIAENHKEYRRRDWDEVKVDIMRDILRTKVEQHEYVRRKLLATGDRELIEDSWRDDFWGWGPNRDGKNMLGKLWMEIRENLRAALEGK